MQAARIALHTLFSSDLPGIGTLTKLGHEFYQPPAMAQAAPDGGWMT